MRVAVVGLARSGRAAAQLAIAKGSEVYASDSGDNESLREAKRVLEEAGVAVDLGGHSVEKIAQCDLIVISPGIPPGAGPLGDARLAGIERISELEFAFRYLASPVIAITGTNGKSTVTSLVSHLLRRAGRDAPAAGNIGTALSEIPLLPQRPDWVVVEASSFQLADIDTFSPRIGVFTNLAPDHLDRYASVEEYYADKANLFRNATERSVWVLNADDAAVLELARGVPGRRFYFSLRGSLPAGEAGGFAGDKGDLYLRLGTDTLIARANELPLLGAHNRANALAAIIAAAAAEVPLDVIRDALLSFRGLPHRLEPVGEYNRVLWINDSKATNIASTRVAIEGMTRPTVLLLGGRHKGEPYTSLLEPMRAHVRLVLAYGEAAPIIEADLKGQIEVERIDGTFEDVVTRAATVARPGETVLLSPACASYDMFRNYEERGDRFRELVTHAAQVHNG